MVTANLSKASGLSEVNPVMAPIAYDPGSGLRWTDMGDPVQYTVVQYSTFSAVLSVQCSTVYCITIIQYSHSTLYGIMYCITTIHYSGVHSTILQHCTILGDRPYSKISNCSNFTVWCSKVEYS